MILWKDPKKPADEKTPKMKLSGIRRVEKGRYTPQLQRKKWNRYLAKEECAFAIIGRERTVDLEAPTVRVRLYGYDLRECDVLSVVPSIGCVHRRLTVTSGLRLSPPGSSGRRLASVQRPSSTLPCTMSKVSESIQVRVSRSMSSVHSRKTICPRHMR